MHFGTNVPEIISYDQDAELAAVRAYNAAIASASGANDQATADLLTTILKDEEEHLGWGETQQSQIEQMGLASYLANQAEGE
jgi:bacterioferritin